MQPKPRKVKLHSKHRFIGDSWSGHQYKAVPWLNVNGIWLEKAGFKAGDTIEIHIIEGLLLIKNLSGHGDTRH